MAAKTAKLTAQGHNGSVERMIDTRKIWAIVQKNWMVLKGDRIRLLPLFIFPILMISLFGFASGNIPKHLPTAIADYDQTPFSRMVSDQLSGVDIFAVKYHVGTQDEGKKLLDSGKVKVLFVLPSGLESKAVAGQPAQIEVMVDESDSSVAQTAKAAAQSFASRLSSQVAQMRLAALSAQVASARADLAAAKCALAGSTDTAKAGALAESSSAYFADAGHSFSQGYAMSSASAQGLTNSLGYLIDQNEIADSFTPASMTSATVALLSTGDSQQATLQQAGMFSLLGAYQAMIFTDARLIYASSQQIAGIAGGQAAAAKVSVAFIGSADAKLEQASGQAERVPSLVDLLVLEPYGYGRRAIDFLLPAMLAMIVFQGATMGLGRAIAGERKDGSLTRVFLTPTSNTTIIFGTQLFYMLLETFRSSMIIVAAIMLFGVTVTGSPLDILAIIAVFAMGATGVGMVLSVLTHSQEQYMAVSMLVSMPIMFLSGVFFPVQTMPEILQVFAQVLPVTYAADALRGVMVKGFTLAQVMPDMIVLTAFALLMLALSIIMFKREIA
ncbi:MAG: ABC transporter permease [Candidatus Micrarchaeota archaeon]|nr:ABC transporter permease [Candidatus Micrarchaeota archaeon]